MTSRVTVLLSLFFLLGVGKVLADTIYLAGILRDQGPSTMWNCGGNPGTANGGAGFSDTDFQISGYQSPEFGLCGAECNSQNGWAPPACGQLGADRTPAYKYSGQSPGKNIGSPNSFHNWFHDSEETVDVSFSLPLTLIPGTSSYTYVNDSFFPLDGRGWGDHCANAQGVQHNFAYCFEAHSRFGYTGVEVFNFAGDDDVWVYINELLVIDLGSLHTKLSKSITLNQNPTLVKGNTYTMDFFYCERHTTESDIEMTTSLQFYCAYTDWCGVCEGTGQSCCTSAIVQKYCDDKTVCTVDTCAVQTSPQNGGCVHTPITCPNATSLCQVSSCDPVQGCQLTDVVCDDQNPCTKDVCNPAVGCQSTPIVCNDNNVCTDDSCSGGTCQFVNTTLTKCDDSNKCTNDACSPTSGCSHATVNCDDNNMCTSDSCDAGTGCVNKDISSTCNDNNACTADSCKTDTGCQNAVIPCNAVDKCHTAACDKVNGCQQTSINCDDGNPCTDDSCAPTTGCVNTPVNCDDGNPCTADSCNSTGGCVNAVIALNCGVCGSVTCTSNDPCNPSICDKATTTCKTVPIVCDDKNACTNDSCSTAANGKSAQCNYKPIVCGDKDSCNLGTCDKTSGCGTIAVVCNDNNNCTNDACSPTPGNATCLYTPVACVAADACHPQSCDALTGTCKITPVDCDDKNMCTTDSCTDIAGVATCQHVSQVCGDDCNPATCNTTTGLCMFQNRTCNDQNPCTMDAPICVNNTTPDCNYTLIPDSCDDNDVCTNDACNSTGTDADHCVHTNITCTPNICQIYTNCNPLNGCQFEPKVCPGSNDFCLQGACDAHAGCITINRVCTVDDPGCYVSVCNSTQSKCIQSQRPDFNSATSQKQSGVLCPLVYNPAVKKGAISAGVIAGIVVGGAVGLAAIGAGGKAGYDFLQARSGGMGNVQGNPLYDAPNSGGTSGLYS